MTDTDFNKMKILESVKKIFKKKEKNEQSFKEQLGETKKVSPFEEFCSDNPDSAECRIYDV